MPCCARCAEIRQRIGAQDRLRHEEIQLLDCHGAFAAVASAVRGVASSTTHATRKSACDRPTWPILSRRRPLVIPCIHAADLERDDVLVTIVSWWIASSRAGIDAPDA